MQECWVCGSEDSFYKGTTSIEIMEQGLPLLKVHFIPSLICKVCDETALPSTLEASIKRWLSGLKPPIKKRLYTYTEIMGGVAEEVAIALENNGNVKTVGDGYRQLDE